MPVALAWTEKERMQALRATEFKRSISDVKNKHLLSTSLFTAILQSSSFIFFQ